MSAPRAICLRGQARRAAAAPWLERMLAYLEEAALRNIVLKFRALVKPAVGVALGARHQASGCQAALAQGRGVDLLSAGGGPVAGLWHAGAICLRRGRLVVANLGLSCTLGQGEKDSISSSLECVQVSKSVVQANPTHPPSTGLWPWLIRYARTLAETRPLPPERSWRRSPSSLPRRHSSRH